LIKAADLLAAQP
jgi:hypothetical protein